MYVVIVCANCNGASQVDEDALGKMVQCPLCGKPTAARTKEAVLPVAKPLEQSVSDAPLSLDDAPASPIANASAKPQAAPVKKAIYIGLSLFATLVLMGLIYGAFRYGNGDIPDSSWKKFKPPDGKCEVSLPGEPEAEEIPAEGFAVLGGKRFVVNRWFEKIRVGFGWIDLDADRLQGVKFDQIALPFRDRELKRLNGKMTAEGTVNFIVGKRPFEARLYQIETDKEKVVLQIYFDADVKRLRSHEIVEKIRDEFQFFAPLGLNPAGVGVPIELKFDQRRLVIDPGEKLRLYFAIIGGKKVVADAPWVTKFFNSFVPE